MSNITVGRILLLDLVFLVNSALTLVVFKFVGLLDVMTTPALFFILLVLILSWHISCFGFIRRFWKTGKTTATINNLVGTVGA